MKLYINLRAASGEDLGILPIANVEIVPVYHEFRTLARAAEEMQDISTAVVRALRRLGLTPCGDAIDLRIAGNVALASGDDVIVPIAVTVSDPDGVIVPLDPGPRMHGRPSSCRL